MMASAVLIVFFVLLLIFSGYTGNWELFDYFWSGGAVISGALLFRARPVRMHVLGFFLAPALLVLIIPHVWTHSVIQNLGWWVISFFLLIFIPTCARSDSDSRTLFEALRWCAAALALLYVVQGALHLPVHGFGLPRSAEAQILIGALACSLFKPVGSAPPAPQVPASPTPAGRWIWILVLIAGLYLNGSRSGLLGAGIVVVGYFWIRHLPLRKIVLMVLAALLVVWATTLRRIESDPHAELRPGIYLLAAQIFSEHTWGVGAGAFLEASLKRNYAVTDPRILSQYAKVNDHAHNALLQWSAEGGILGLATALAVILCACILLALKWRREKSSWVAAAAVVWCPAFALELMLNVTERLSAVRWMALAGVIVLTAEYSVVWMARPKTIFRLAMILIGAGFLYVGTNDLFAKLAIRAGIRQEQTRMFPDALASYQEAHERRPWDEQPLLHMAQVALRLDRFDLVESSIDHALILDEGPGEVHYFGSLFYSEMHRRAKSGGLNADALFHQGRHLMLSLNEMHPYDAPSLLSGIEWSRTVSERRWKLSRVVSLEPRAARAYRDLSRLAWEAGDVARAQRFANFAGHLERFYGPAILRGLAEFSPTNRNMSRYEIHLIDKPNPL